MAEHKKLGSSFQQRKYRILDQLAVPALGYQDRSPKGSIDSGIRSLIEDINAQEGFVSLSSCAGRISVFLEGDRKRRCTNTVSELEDVVQVPREKDGVDDPNVLGDLNAEAASSELARFSGKGGGSWLYVSHDPVSSTIGASDGSFLKLFGMSREEADLPDMSSGGLRHVHFKFEPLVGRFLILHILTASLKHAQIILTAATQAGFRESGATNILPATDGQQPVPMVAIRCLGLGFDSIIGYFQDTNAAAEQRVIRSLVTEDYLRVLVSLANRKFAENSKRRDRFRAKFLELCHSDRLGEPRLGRSNWEDADSRRERKKAEGLTRRQILGKRNDQKRVDHEDLDMAMTEYGSDQPFQHLE